MSEHPSRRSRAGGLEGYPLRFVWAVVAFVLAAILIGAGMAQRTVLLGPKTVEVTTEVADSTLPYTVIDGSALTSSPGSQTITADSEGEVFGAYGRTADVQAWLSESDYNLITLDDSGALISEVVQATADDSEAADADAGRDPAGSDLWLDEFSGDGGITERLQLPDTMSVLLAADGSSPAPSVVSFRWPIANATPWAGPLIALGVLIGLVGVFLYVLAIRHVRRSRGPRRKSLPPLPETEPLEVQSADKGVISSGAPRRRSIKGKRALLVLPAVGLSALLFTGCTAEAWPQFGEPTPSPTSTVLVPEGQPEPVVTEAQAQRILSRAAATVAEADDAADADLAAQRLGGAVLDERKANYTIRGEVADYPHPEAIPTTLEDYTVPQAYDGWPRSVLLVASDTVPESTVPEASATPTDDASEEPAEAPTILVMRQEDPWSDYKIVYLAHLAAAQELPEVAPSTIGAIQVPPDSTFLVMQPDEVAQAYADVLNKGNDSEFAGLFSEDGDQFRTKVSEDRASRLEDFNKTGAETGSLTFSSAAGSYDPFALASLESGAIVAVSLTETDTVKPTNEDAVIKLDNNETVKALAGTGTSASGFTTDYSDQLFFYVPNKASGGQIQLLAYGSNILDAGVIQ